MRGTHVDFLPGFGIDPSAGNAAAGERQSVRTILVDDGQLKLTVERRGGDVLPLHIKNLLRGNVVHLDLDQGKR